MARVKRGVVAHARHKKVLKQAKGYYGARRRCTGLPNRQLSRQVNMHIAIVVHVSVRSAVCGLSVSTLPHGNLICHTAVSWMA